MSEIMMIENSYLGCSKQCQTYFVPICGAKSYRESNFVKKNLDFGTVVMSCLPDFFEQFADFDSIWLMQPSKLRQSRLCKSTENLDS